MHSPWNLSEKVETLIEYHKSKSDTDAEMGSVASGKGNEVSSKGVTMTGEVIVHSD